MSRPKVRLERGGARQIVESGGSIVVQSGGTITLESGAVFDPDDLGLVHYDDGVEVGFGDDDDVLLSFDGTSFLVGALADDTPIKVGDGTNSFDLQWFGNTSSDYISFDASANVLSLHGAVTALLTGGAAAAFVAARLGKTVTEGLEIRVIDEVVTTTNAVETNLTQTVPAGAVILSVQGNLDTLIVGDASGDNLGVKVGIGTTATPNKYGLTSALTQNLKIDTIPDWAVLSGAETVCVKLAKTDGSAATEKFVAEGLVRVRIVYAVCNSLDNAA